MEQTNARDQVDFLSQEFPQITNSILHLREVSPISVEYSNDSNFPRKKVRSIELPQEDQFSLEWWGKTFSLKGYSPKFFVAILALPGDKYIFEYLERYEDELAVLSSDSGLIVFLTQKRFQVVSQKARTFSPEVSPIVWSEYCTEIAKLLGIRFEDFPCLLIFDHLFSSTFTMVSLRDLDVEQLVNRFRIIFSEVSEAVEANSSPMVAIQKAERLRGYRKTGKSILARLSFFAEETFKAIVAAASTAAFK